MMSRAEITPQDKEMRAATDQYLRCYAREDTGEKVELDEGPFLAFKALMRGEP